MASVSSRLTLTVVSGSPTFSHVTYSDWFEYGSCYTHSAPCIAGDTFFNTWGDDDLIYTTSDDSSGFNNVGTRNLWVHSLSGWTAGLVGTNVNSMDAFGGQGQSGSDGATYKATSMISVHGTLYIAVSRQGPAPNYTYLSNQLIKSTDHGVTWTPLPPATAQPYASATFLDPKFRTPFFFQYGKDYVGQTVDRSDQFVYALASDQTGSYLHYTLGRVAISSISNLDANDWQYYQGGDGLVDTNWGSLATAAQVIHDGRGHLGQGAILYLPYFQKYLLLDWGGTTPPDTYFAIYRGDHPWGPWTFVQQDNWTPATAPPALASGATGFYWPGLVAKSLSVDGGRTVEVFTTGVFYVGGMYTLIGAKLTLS